MSERRTINEFEWLRVFAAAAVVMIHVICGISDNATVIEVGQARAIWWGILQVIVRWAVPVFLMITGALLLNPEKRLGWEKIKRYSFRMAGVLLTFGFVYCLTELVFASREISIGVVYNAVINLLQGRSWSHMWYVYALLGLYLLLPIFRAYVASASRHDMQITLTILAIFTLIVPMVNNVFGVGLSNLVWLTSSSFYLLLGWYAYTYLNLTVMGGAVGCVCAFAAIALKCAGALMFDSWFNWVDSPTNPLIAGWSLVVFLAGKRWLNVPYGKVIGALSSASFGIYLVHPIFLNVFYKVGHIRETFLPPLVFEMVIWALTFAGSYALTMILSKVPLIKRLL